MTWTRRTVTILGAALAAVALLVGAGAAIAASSASSDDELSRVAEGLRQKDALSTAVAKELGTTAAKVEAAIATAAKSRIDAAEKAGSLSASDADLLREALADGDRMALRIAQAADVAKALGVTQAKLDDAYAKAHKARALERVAQAEKDELITKKVADEMRARIADMTFPGFGAGGFGHGGHGFGGMGRMGHGGFGHGFGPSSGMPGGGATAPSAAWSTEPAGSPL